MRNQMIQPNALETFVVIENLIQTYNARSFIVTVNNRYTFICIAHIIKRISPKQTLNYDIKSAESKTEFKK